MKNQHIVVISFSGWPWVASHSVCHQKLLLTVAAKPVACNTFINFEYNVQKSTCVMSRHSDETTVRVSWAVTILLNHLNFNYVYTGFCYWKTVIHNTILYWFKRTTKVIGIWGHSEGQGVHGLQLGSNITGYSDVYHKISQDICSIKSRICLGSSSWTHFLALRWLRNDCIQVPLPSHSGLIQHRLPTEFVWFPAETIKESKNDIFKICYSDPVQPLNQNLSTMDKISKMGDQLTVEKKDELAFRADHRLAV